MSTLSGFAMRTAVDSSVILDVLTADVKHAERSEAALQKAGGDGALIVCEVVLAEIAPVFAGDPREMREFLDDWGLTFVPSSLESALLAGAMFCTYLSRRPEPRRVRVVADFLIGAHAKCGADRLLARDRGYYRDYFKALKLLEP